MQRTGQPGRTDVGPSKLNFDIMEGMLVAAVDTGSSGVS